MDIQTIITECKASEIIIPIEHSVKGGVYTRIAYAKAGTVLLGAEHKQGGVATLLKGKIKQIDGDSMYEVGAPFIINTEPGSQRVAHVLEDCIYATMHSTTCNSPEEAEKELFEGTAQITRIRESFKNLGLIGYNKFYARLENSLKGNIYKADSSIHGQGIFTSKDFKINEPIALIKYQNLYTEVYSYLNHSDIPNAEIIKDKDGDYSLIAIRDIQKENEIFIDYRRNKCQ